MSNGDIVMELQFDDGWKYLRHRIEKANVRYFSREVCTICFHTNVKTQKLFWVENIIYFLV